MKNIDITQSNHAQELLVSPGGLHFQIWMIQI